MPQPRRKPVRSIEVDEAAPSGRGAAPEPSKRDRIVRAAQQLFVSKGFGRTTVSAICAAARTSKRDFYAHFADREAVFLEAAKQLTDPPVPDRPAVRGHPQNVLAAFADRVLLSTASPEALGVFRAGIMAGSMSPSLGRAVHQARVDAGADVAEYLAQARAIGIVEFDDAALALQRFSFLVLDGIYWLTGRAPLQGSVRERRAARIAELFLSGRATASLSPGSALSGLSIEPGATLAPARDRPVAVEGATRLSARRWDDFLEIAWGEFREKGLTAGSVDRISGASGIPKNTIYRRFRTKDELFEESCRWVIDLRLLSYDMPDWRARDVHGTLVALAEKIIGHFCLSDSVALHRMLIVEAGRIPEITARLYDRLMDDVCDTLMPIFEMLDALRFIEAPHPREAAWQFFVIATIGSRFLFVTPDEAETTRLAAEAVDTFLFGVMRRPSAGRLSSDPR